MKKENCHLFSLGLMFVRCLSCHVTPQSLALTRPTFPRYDGVGLQGPCSADSPELHVSIMDARDAGEARDTLFRRDC